MDFERMADGVYKAVQSHIERAISPIAERLKALEERQPERGEKGDKGDPGKDAEPVEVTTDDLRAAIKAEPEFMREIVADYLKDNPPPAGKDGEKGDPGKDAEPVEVTLADIRDAIKSEPEFMREVVAEHLKANPPAPGKDGVGLAGFVINRDNHLIASTTDGKAHDLGPVVGKDGEPGRDGVDLSDVEFEYDGERSFTVKAKGGQVVRTYQMPVIIDKGYWREGNAADAGDAYTHDGSLWIAQRKTTARPSTQAKDDWRLAARKGRDGKPGRDATPKKDGPIDLNGDDDA